MLSNKCNRIRIDFKGYQSKDGTIRQELSKKQMKLREILWRQTIEFRDPDCALHRHLEIIECHNIMEDLNVALRGSIDYPIESNQQPRESRISVYKLEAPFP